MKKGGEKSAQLFWRGKISNNFIYPSLSSSEEKIQKYISFKIIGPHHTLKSPCKVLDQISFHEIVSVCLTQMIHPFYQLGNQFETKKNESNVKII